MAKRQTKAKIGHTYDAYFDGKHSPSRLCRVVIDDVIPRSELSHWAKNRWKKEIKDDMQDVLDGVFGYQFWDWNCEVFLEGHIVGDKDTEKDSILFALRPSGGWYGINWNYELDVSGSVRREMVKQWREVADENGWVLKIDRKTKEIRAYDRKTGEEVER